MTKSISATALVVALLACSAAAITQAASALQNDRAFVGKVSQAALYEIIASRYAQQTASNSDVKAVARIEARDHTAVRNQLKRIAVAKGITFAPGLNALFTARLTKLRNVPKPQFDAAYIADMERVHDKGLKLFTQEAIDGSRQFRAFAQQTIPTIKQHIAALHKAHV